VVDIIQGKNAASFQNIESFFLFPVAVHRYASASPHLLGAEGEIGGAGGRADPDENSPASAK